MPEIVNNIPGPSESEGLLGLAVAAGLGAVAAVFTDRRRCRHDQEQRDEQYRHENEQRDEQYRRDQEQRNEQFRRDREQRAEQFKHEREQTAGECTIATATTRRPAPARATSARGGEAFVRAGCGLITVVAAVLGDLYWGPAKLVQAQRRLERRASATE